LTTVSEPCVALALPAFRSALERENGQRGAMPSLRDTRWLASRGRRGATPQHDWRGWLLSRFGPGADTLQRCPAGVSVRALASGGRDPGCWACAQPVHLLTGLDHLRLAPLADLALSPEEAQALADSINAALAGSGYALWRAEPGPWSLGCSTDIECDTVEPAQAEGRDIRDCLPAGRDGARVRKLMNELQMLLHEHPINMARAGRGLAPVNSLWLWGFGRAREPAIGPLPALCSDDAWLNGLWRLRGGEARSLAAAERALATETTLLIAATGVGPDPAAELDGWEAGLCAPLATALRRGRIRSASVLLGDASFAITKADRFAVWRRRRSWQELLR
jgi:hypothetical protein